MAGLMLAFSAKAGNGKFGVIGGLTTANTRISSAYADIKTGSVSNFHVGLVYNQPLLLGFSIQPGIQYNVKGAELRNIGAVSDLDLKTGFIEIPVQVQWAPFDILGLVKPYLFVEPFIGYAVGNRLVSSKASVDTDKIKSGFEGGLGLGIGVLAIKHIQVSARYYWNLGQLYTIDIQGVPSQINQNNCSGIAVSAAILF